MGKADSKVLNQLGDIYVNDGTYKIAYEAYRDAVISGDGKESVPPIRSVDILVSVGEYEYASALLETIREIRKGEFKEKDKLKVLQLEARLLFAKGEEVGAVSRLEEIVEKDPLDGESILLLADYYGRNEKAEKAELFYQRAEQIDLFEVSWSPLIYAALRSLTQHAPRAHRFSRRDLLSFNRVKAGNLHH